MRHAGLNVGENFLAIRIAQQVDFIHDDEEVAHMAAQIEQEGYQRAANDIESQLLAGVSTIGSKGVDPTAVHAFATQLRTQKALGRISLIADPSILAAHPNQDPLLEAGDVVFIPQRPSTVAVLGEVMQPGSYSYQPGMTVEDYVKKAGGYAQFSDSSLTFVVMPDGTARKLEKSFFGFQSAQLPPGSAIVVPRDLTPIDTRQIVLDVTGILSQLAVSLASLAVISMSRSQSLNWMKMLAPSGRLFEFIWRMPDSVARASSAGRVMVRSTSSGVDPG